MSGFNTLMSRELVKAHQTYQYTGVDPETRRYRGLEKMDLARRAAETLHSWLGEGQTTGIWQKPVAGWTKKDLGYNITHKNLLEAALYAYMAHSNARLQSLHEHVGRFVSENDSIDENIPHETLQDLLSNDLQQFTYVGKRGSPVKRNVNRQVRKILVESRLLAEDIYRKRIAEEELAGLKDKPDPNREAELLSRIKRYQERINEYHPAVVLFNAALAHAELDRDSAGHLPRNKLEKLSAAVFTEYGPRLRQLGLYRAGSELENKAFREFYEDQWANIRGWMQSHETDIREAKNRWPKELKQILDEATDEHGKPLFVDENGEKIGVTVELRDKDAYGIFRKMQLSGKSSPDSVHDVLGARIIIHAPDRKSGAKYCFKAKSILQTALPKQSRLAVQAVDFPHAKNYLVNPKPNGYEAIHGVIHIKKTGFFGLSRVGQIELQILDEHRHRFNESPKGASHWSHKIGRYGGGVGPYAGEHVSEVLGGRVPKPETVRVWVHTRTKNGDFESRFFDLPPSRNIMDVLGHALPNELGRRHISVSLHPQSENPPSRPFHRWRPHLFAPIFDGMHIQALPEDREVEPKQIRSWLTRPLSENTQIILRTAATTTRKLK